MGRTAPDGRMEEYRRLRLDGISKIHGGEFTAALVDFQRALLLARRMGDARLQHEAQANLSMAFIQLGEDRKAERGLREILLNTQDPKLRFGASYNLAVSLRKQGRYGRARFYVRHAMENAARLRDASRRAVCHNVLGNILMNQSCLEEALVEYRKALSIRRRQKHDVRFSIAILLENIGYTYVLQKKHRRGEVMIRRALALAMEIDDKLRIAESYQDLCYAAMQMGRYREAAESGQRALDIAKSHGYRDIEKNCYYLLGETAHLAGLPDERDRQFEKLQSLHPELPFLRDFLCAFDLSGIITLKR